uniref:TNF decoy receptor 3 n=1 Tax=Conger myriaster TaxID=7943 RepID=B1B390_CONMY|nr:TNF decoy receptor 3 [Conger myriaster]
MKTLLIIFLAALAFAPFDGSELIVSTYQWTDDVTGFPVTCDKCPPGTHVVKHCTKDRKTVCGLCPERHYTAFWNYVERCLYCNVFCMEDQFEKLPCNTTHNRVCECKSGHYFNHGFCTKHSACPPGQGASMTGTAYTDVKCVKCEEGYFSSEYSTMNQCQKQHQCKDGERTIPSNEKRDTFCTLCKINSSGLPSSPEDQAVCDRAVMDYVSQYPLHHKKHKRLENAVRRMAKEKDKNVPLIDMFLTIQKSHGDQPFVNIMIKILNKYHLINLECKVKKWFLGEEEC